MVCIACNSYSSANFATANPIGAELKVCIPLRLEAEESGLCRLDEDSGGNRMGGSIHY